MESGELYFSANTSPADRFERISLNINDIRSSVGAAVDPSQRDNSRVFSVSPDFKPFIYISVVKPKNYRLIISKKEKNRTLGN